MRPKLYKAFSSAALSVGLIVAGAAMPSQTEAAPTAAAGHGGVRRTAVINAAISDPSDYNIKRLQDTRAVDAKAIPYVRVAVEEMNTSERLTPEQVTGHHRAQFLQLVQEKQKMAYIYAKTADEAVEKGLGKWLTPYFGACTANLSSQPEVQASQKAEQCMKSQYRRQVEVPAMLQGLSGTAVLIALVIGTEAISRRRKKDGQTLLVESNKP